MANNNNDNITAGDFLSLSSLPGISAFGKNLSKREERKLEQELKDRVPINLGNGVLYNSKDRTSQVDPNFAKQLEERRTHEMNLMNAKLARKDEEKTEKRKLKLEDAAVKRAQQIEDRNYKAQQKLKPSAKTSADMAGMQNTIDDGQGMMLALDDNPEAIEQFWDMPAQVVRNAGGDTVANVIESFVKTPEELSVKQRMNSFVAELRKRLSGSALTTMEASLGSGYLPNASGITQAEARERLRNIIKYMEGELNLNKERYGMTQTDVDEKAPEKVNELDGASDEDLAKILAELEQKAGN